MHRTQDQRKSTQLLSQSQNAKATKQKQDQILPRNCALQNAEQQAAGLQERGELKDTIYYNISNSKNERPDTKEFMKSVNMPRNKNLKWGASKNSNAMKRIQRLYTQMPISSTHLQTHISRANATIKNNHSLVPRQTYNHTSINIEKDIKNKSFAKELFGVCKDNPDKKLVALNKKHPPYGTKEGLYEENWKLKNTINELKSELANQKMSVEVERRKNKKYTRRLNRQFKKQFYYSHQYRDVDIEIEQMEVGQDAGEEESIKKIYQNNGQGPDRATAMDGDEGEQLAGSRQYRYLEKPSMNSIQHEQGFAYSQQYMIAGIKQKHEQLQVEHNRVVKQLHTLKAADGRKKLQQVSLYCLVLEQSNRKLATGLQICNEKLLACERKQEKDEDTYKKAVVFQLNQKIECLKSKHVSLQQENKELRSQSKESAKVIQYLQQLVISKENLQYKSANSLKKLARILTSLEAQLNEEREYNRNLKETYIKQLQDASSQSNEKLEKQRQIFQEALIEKNVEVKKLEKEMKYMATIIQNWKLTETKFDREGLPADKLVRKQSYESIKQQGTEKKVEQPSLVKSITGRIELEKKYEQKIGNVASLTNRTQFQAEALSRTNTQKQDANGCLRLITERKRKTAGTKHSENCKKMRKVCIQQISELAEYIRYRMIGSNIQLEQVCKYLDYRPLEANSKAIDDGSDEIEKWKKLYISQADLIAVLAQQPFKLKPQDAVNLARYVIQDECFYENGDETNGFVYANLENEMERNIAKSILKAFIQTQSSNFLASEDRKTSQYQACEKEWQKVLAERGAKINTPLISIAPNGFISKQRWNELLKSINVQLSQNLMEWCIGRMIMESEGLSKLKYRAIIPEDI